MTEGTSCAIERAFCYRRMGVWIAPRREKDSETKDLTLGTAAPSGGTCQAPLRAQFSFRFVATGGSFLHSKAQMLMQRC